MLSIKSIILLVTFILLGILGVSYIITDRQEAAALKREKAEWEEEQRSFAQSLPQAGLYFYRLNAVIFDPSYRTVHIRRYQDSDHDISIGYDKITGITKNMAAYTLIIKTNDPSHPSIVIKALPGAGWENTQDPEQIVRAFQAVISRNQTGTMESNEKESPDTAASRSNPYSVYHPGSAPERSGNKGNAAVILIVLGLTGAVFLASLGGESSDSLAESSSSVSRFSLSSSSAKPEVAPIVYETELTCGNYIAGIDFPAGVYDFLALSGNGNVITDASGRGRVNTIMGVSGSLNGYDVTYQNVRLSDGVTLHIGGDLHLQIHSDAASGEPLLSRGQQFMDSFDLGAGDYLAGDDFAAGTYDIICTSGFGNISSGNVDRFYLNEIMGYDKPGYIARADNIELPEGATLHISGITVTMSPSE